MCFVMHDLLNDLAKYVSEDMCIRLGVDKAKGLPKTTDHLSFATNYVEYFDGFGGLHDTQRLIHLYKQIGEWIILLVIIGIARCQ